MERLMPLTIYTVEAICLAVQRRAAKDGVSASDVVNAILRGALAAEIAEAAGAAPLASAIQNLFERCQPQPANGSHRPVSSPGKLTE